MVLIIYQHLYRGHASDVDVERANFNKYTLDHTINKLRQG